MIDIVYNNPNFRKFCFQKHLAEVDICVFAAFVYANPDDDRRAFFLNIDDNANVVVSYYYGEIDPDTGEALDLDCVEEYNIPLEKVFESFKHHIESFLTQDKEKDNLPF